jgi:hypothetical protein
MCSGIVRLSCPTPLRAVSLRSRERVQRLGDLLGGALEHPAVGHHSDSHRQFSLGLASSQSPLGR